MNEANILRTESHEFITKETTCIGVLPFFGKIDNNNNNNSNY